MRSLNQLSRCLSTIEAKVFTRPSLLSDEQQEEKELCESSFLLFVSKAWSIIEGDSPFIYGWHVQAICEHLEALHRLDINRLIINCPPRIGKSNLASVLLPAWIWTHKPDIRFLYSSYAQSLSVRDSVRTRRLIQSPWYQSLWGDKFKLTGDQNSKIRFENDKTGYRIASSVGSANTGEGGHWQISDDLNSVTDNRSEATLETTRDWFFSVMSTRHSGLMSEFRRLNIQQRTHEKDVTGSILATDDSRWVHLCLPMEYEPHRKCQTIVLKDQFGKERYDGKPWEDPRTYEDELLWPQGIDEEALDLLKSKDFQNDTYRISGQLQQRPSPAEGGIIKGDWLKLWKNDIPEFEYIITSWDTALTSGATSCYSAATTFGIFKDKGGINNIMLLSLFREKVDYPDLRKAATRMAYNYSDIFLNDPPLSYRRAPDLVLVEAKVSGYSLFQDLQRANIPILKFNPNKYGDKIGRCHIVSHIFENGLVWLPTDPPHFEYLTEDSQIFLEALINFPNTESNDIVDSMTQALIHLISGGWAMNKEDPIDQKDPLYQKPYY